jgi:ABC-type branched-subunit amino acid transport system ATPase component
MTAVATHALAVGRGVAPVLTGVELVVARGERLALVGGNGAGKWRASCFLSVPR